VPYPTDETISVVADEETVREKLPFAFVDVAAVEFFTVTEAPVRGLLFSSLISPRR